MTAREVQNQPFEAVDLPSLLGVINYIIPVNDASPYDASIMQGFAPSMISKSEIINLVCSLPSDIWELTPEGFDIRLARRISGQAPISWHGQSPRALTSFVTPPFCPFLVVFLGENDRIETYRDWIDAHTFPLVVVAKRGGTLTYNEFGIESVRLAFLKICDALEGQINPTDLSAARRALESWRDDNERELGYSVGGHNAFLPSIAALSAAGFRNVVAEPFKDIGRGNGPYVETIARLARSILEERDRVRQTGENRRFPPTPAINLFAPAIYSHFHEIGVGGAQFDADTKREFLAVQRMFKQQDGYGFAISNKSQKKAVIGRMRDGKPQPNPLIAHRAGELRLGSTAVATLAASEISAVIRLPNSVNRTAGQVRQFAQHYHAKTMNDRKRRESFAAVQKAIDSSVPPELREFVENAEQGVRIIADAHLEWMSVRGLPLCVQKDVTKIPVTPGNLFLSQVSPQTPIHLTISDFEEVLILSALQEGDPISGIFEAAINIFEPHFAKKIKVRSERVYDELGLRNVLNSYRGAIVFFDGHGSHKDGQAASLQLINEEFDVWQLRKDPPRLPPIVILSACSTHAADRNHATTANGFLAAGARSVLGSAFPIDARDAAAFVARLIYRVAEFLPLVHKETDQSETWMNVLGGMIRMQLLTDFCRRLQRSGFLDDHKYHDIHLAGNVAINGGHPWPFEAVVEKLEELGLDRKRMLHELRSAAANSTAISYLQLGRSESIIIHPDMEK